MNTEDRAAQEIAAVFVKHGLDYNGTKGPVAKARKIAGLARPRDRKTVIDRLAVEEERAFLDAAWSKSGKRGLMLRTLLETATRNAELVALDVRHVDTRHRHVEVHEGKGGKSRIVPITRDLANLLDLHIGHRRAGPLFRSRERGRGVPYQFSTRRVRQLVRETAAEAGIEKRVYPHLLRHTTATRLLLDGMPLHDVALFLGHESTKTTERYAAASTAALRRSFDQIMGDAGAEALVHQIRERRGDYAAAFAADLLTARPGGLHLVAGDDPWAA